MAVVKEMTDNRSKWGGARPGAGRKPSPVKRTAVSIYLTPDQRAAYDALRARGVDVRDIFVRELLRMADGTI